MTTPTSVPISLSDVMAELRVTNSARAYPINLGDTDVRSLAGIPSGAISLSNLLGKSAGVQYVMRTGYYFDGTDIFVGYGIDEQGSSLTPTTLNGKSIVYILQVQNGVFYITLFTNNQVAQSFFNSITINGHTYNTATASSFYSALGPSSYSQWVWNSPDSGIVNGTYPSTFNIILA